MSRKSMHYYVNYDKICMGKLVELVYDSPNLLKLIIENLCSKSPKNSWRVHFSYYISRKYGIFNYHGKIKALFAGLHQEKNFKTHSCFGPLQPEFDLKLGIPQKSVYFITNTIELMALNAILEEFISIDCEWRSSILKMHESKVSILQIGCFSKVLIIDLINFTDLSVLNKELRYLFNRCSAVIGVGFGNDLKLLRKQYPALTVFQSPLHNFIDLLSAFAYLKGSSAGSLSGACEIMLGKGLCKYEQRSNWEKRPLSQSQLHYAALDVHSQVLIFQKFNINYKKKIQKINNCKVQSPAFGCDYCGSKMHEFNYCKRGPRCKICYKTGHTPEMCTDFN